MEPANFPEIYTGNEDESRKRNKRPKGSILTGTNKTGKQRKKGEARVDLH